MHFSHHAFSLDQEEAEMTDLLAMVRERLEPRLARQDIGLRWHVGDMHGAQVLPPERAAHVLRVVQESLTNILKHANAQEISISADVQGDEYLVAIGDDGCGLTRSTHSSGGRGLGNIKARAQQLGGRVIIGHNPDTKSGTLVKL